MTNEMHNSVIINFIPRFFCLLYMYRTIVVVHHQFNAYSTIVPNFVILYSKLFCAPGDERLDSFDTCRADKNSCNKIDYNRIVQLAGHYALKDCTFACNICAAR